MNELQRRYGDRGLTIVAINVDKNPADAVGDGETDDLAGAKTKVDVLEDVDATE